MTIRHYRGGNRLNSFSVQSRGARVHTYGYDADERFETAVSELPQQAPDGADLEWLSQLLDLEDSSTGREL